MRASLAVVPALVLAASAASCMDPVHSDAVDALGPEAAGVPEGPTHRPGQPCTVCHGGSGPGSPEFSVAGTVYVTRDARDPAIGADVVLTDARGASRTFRTNEVGTFYSSKAEWVPAFPLQVTVSYGGTSKPMKTLVGGDGGCARCHRDPEDSGHMPHVYVEGP